MKVDSQYHLNCQDITDKIGDIEIFLIRSNRKTVSAGWLLKIDQSNVNQRNLSHSCRQLRKRKCIFNSRSIVRLLLTNEVILNFV